MPRRKWKARPGARRRSVGVLWEAVKDVKGAEAGSTVRGGKADEGAGRTGTPVSRALATSRRTP